MFVSLLMYYNNLLALITAYHVAIIMGKVTYTSCYAVAIVAC